jgi:hypothetical protein
MAWIRIGHFEDFKGSDTLLIECDEQGLQSLIDVILHVGEAGGRSILEEHPVVRAYGGISVVIERSQEYVGLIAVGARHFVWRRSSEAWEDVVDKLRAMQHAGPCHQYLDGPSDNLQVMAAIGEYGGDWWEIHAD